MEFIDLPQMVSAGGTVRLPGSKSISNRVLLLAALAEGTTEIRDLLVSDDTARMLEALGALGIPVNDLGGGCRTVVGCKGDIPVKRADLFLGNAGTAFRPLTAALALAGGEYILRGVARMHERPIGDLVDSLRQLGADITYQGDEGYPPLYLKPAVAAPAAIIAGNVIQVRGDVSSQFLTALLMALPLTGVETRIEVVGKLISRPYIEITLAIMARFGVHVTHDDWQVFTVPAGARYVSPGTVYVEGDASSASYFLALGAIGGGPVRVEGVGEDSIQGDVRFTEALARMGAIIEMGPNWIEARAPKEGLKGVTLDCNHIPDAAMTLATVALFAQGETRLNNIASWRVKETDRIFAMATELRKLGVEVEEGEDYLRVIPPERMKPAAIDTYDDHRIAMCFSLAAFGTPVRINDPGCTAKTFPEYFDYFAAVTVPVPVITIDGPSASGKGTVAARVAEALGFHYLDSGMLYRLAALVAKEAGVAWDDDPGVAALVSTLDVEFREGGIFLGGQGNEREVSDLIRTEDISDGASKVAALPGVRQALLFRQRTFYRFPGLVGDGRDLGSVVFPGAGLKVFLTASSRVRAERRYKQLLEAGQSVDMAAILKDLEERDERDSRRAVAPLRQEEDALLLDTSDLGVEAAVRQVLDWYGSSLYMLK